MKLGNIRAVCPTCGTECEMGTRTTRELLPLSDGRRVNIEGSEEFYTPLISSARQEEMRDLLIEARQNLTATLTSMRLEPRITKLLEETHYAWK